MSFLNLLGWLIPQRTTAALAGVHRVNFDTIRLLDPLERVPLMSGLSARLALAFLAKALGRRFVEPIAGGRLAAVARVLGQLILKLLDLRLQILDALLQRVETRVRLQEHRHHGLWPRLVDGQCLFARQHAHNSRRKSWIKG